MKWERNEKILSQRVVKLGKGKYAHVEIVKYKKRKSPKRSRKDPFYPRMKLGGGI